MCICTDYLMIYILIQLQDNHKLPKESNDNSVILIILHERRKYFCSWNTSSVINIYENNYWIMIVEKLQYNQICINRDLDIRFHSNMCLFL